ncbi:MAG: hypothetical protein OHK0037_22680 [Elainellaceae cyanobacterium]
MKKLHFSATLPPLCQLAQKPSPLGSGEPTALGEAFPQTPAWGTKRVPQTPSDLGFGWAVEMLSAPDSTGFVAMQV